MYCMLARIILSVKFEKGIPVNAVPTLQGHSRYSKTCLKWPLKNRQNKGLNGK